MISIHYMSLQHIHRGIHVINIRLIDRGFQEQTKVIYKETSNMTNHFTIHVSLYKTVALGPKATGSIVARWAPNIRSIASARFEPAVF